MSSEYLDHPAVKAYRDAFKFCPNLGFRKEIVQTVTDLDLWKSILSTWGFAKDGKWKAHNPLNVKGMMQEYERRASQHTKRSDGPAGGIHSEPRPDEKDVSVRLPERRDSYLSRVPEAERHNPRRSDRNFDELLAEALQKMQKAS